MNIDDYINTELNCGQVLPITTINGETILDREYSDQSFFIAKYISDLQRFPDMDRKAFRAFRAKAHRYVLKDRHLFRRASKNILMRHVVDSAVQKKRILKNLHDKRGHRGRESTYRRVADRYWWKGLNKDIKEFIRTCERCQRRDSTRMEEPLHPTWVNVLWKKIAVDVIYMPASKGKNFLVVARDNFCGWPEARTLKSATSAHVAKFIWEDVICRYGCFNKLIVYGGSENKNLIIELTQRYDIKRIVTSVYHPQANGMIERGHRPIKDALAKMSGSWVNNLHAVLLADRSTVRKSTGYSPFYLDRGSDAVLPIKLDIPTWKILPWHEIHDTGDLLALRARQIQRRDEDLEEAALHLRRMREEGKETFDAKHRFREDEIVVGDMVLFHDTKEDKNLSARLEYRWLGPYRVHKTIPLKGTYLLTELEGAVLRGTFAGNRLKKFHTRAILSDLEIDNEVDHGAANFRKGNGIAVAAREEEDEDEEENRYLTKKALKYSQENQAFVPEGQSFAIVI